MKIDFHIHTHFSKCSELDPKKAVSIAEEKGLDVIALINHDIKPKKFKGTKKVKVIPGVEVSTKEGHLLVINTTQEFRKGIKAQEVIDKARNDALIIIPHPFDFFRKGIGGSIKELNNYHAIELNARCLFQRINKKTRAFAKKNKIPLIAGSDAHFPGEIGNAYTIVNAQTIKQAIKKIKQGKTRCYIRKRPSYNKLKYFFKSMIPRSNPK
jgi:hypothetical protein